MDYLEVIGNAQPLVCSAAPYIAIPTTAGTGSEVTRNAVLGSPEHRVKVSMRSPFMLPDLAVVDPELTVSLSPSITASTGLDAFTQLMEAFVSSQANAMTDGICREGLLRAAESLQRVYENGNDRSARENMCLASLFSGLALANAKLGAIHGIAGPLGGMISGAHGAICAGLLPYVVETNIKALRMRAADSPALQRYTELAGILTQKRQSPGRRWDGVDKKSLPESSDPIIGAPGLDQKRFSDSSRKLSIREQHAGEPDPPDPRRITRNFAQSPLA